MRYNKTKPQSSALKQSSDSHCASICQKNEVRHHAGVVRFVRARALLHVCSLQRQGGLCKSYYCSSTSSMSCWWKTQFIHIVYLLGLPVRPSVCPPLKQACLLCCLVAMVSSRPPAHSAVKDKVPTLGRVFRNFRSEGFNAKSRVWSECR